jgi:hypothetical protein
MEEVKELKNKKSQEYEFVEQHCNITKKLLGNYDFECKSCLKTFTGSLASANVHCSGVAKNNIRVAACSVCLG